jgi:protein-L-isoaspartate O-methyltransferase
MSNHTATYDPADDKLRLSPAGRLPADEYTEIKAAGFSWAPKQEVFYAIWTPARESLMLSWCGEIDDEDTSLVDRAAVRADRFDDYSDKRTNDAERAHKAVAGICESIPFGQPILVGHHSEKRARKDAEKIERGMERAVKMWDQAEYWKNRAASAIAHAKYKELPAVRARRIKGLEADKRKRVKQLAESATSFQFWNGDLALKNGTNPGVTYERALNWLNRYDGYSTVTLENGDKVSAWSALESNKITIGMITEQRIKQLTVYGTYCQNWLDHINNRLDYEKAMLAEGGGLKSDGFDLQIGGKVQRRGQWFVITKLNKKAGITTSVSVIGHFAATVQVEEITDYLPPTEEDAAKTKAATALAPMCNYKIEGCATMTQAEFTATYKDHKGSDTIAATDTSGRHRVRTISGFLARRHGAVIDDSYRSQWGSVSVFISDAKVKAAPAPDKTEIKAELPAVPRELPRQREYVAPEPTKADELREQLKAGVKVVSAPQLFPTPAPLAARMVELADLKDGVTVLEPSAGTGRIITEIMKAVGTEIVAFEINHELCNQLTASFPSYVLQARCKDFLEVEDGAGQWERILMNPPFAGGADIKHIKHAYELLAPGGKLVAICAGGPRQAEQLKPLCDTWEVLPAGTFEESGTGVNSVMLSMNKPTATIKESFTVQPEYIEQAVNNTLDFQLTFEQTRYPDPSRVQQVRAKQAKLF